MGTDTDTETDTTDDDELFDAETARNPQPSFKMMRDLAPVVELPETAPFSGVVVAKHEDVTTVLRTPEIFSSGFDAVHIGQVRPLIPLQIDPPDHSRYRKLLDPLFAPRRIAYLEDRIRALASDLIDSFVDDGGCDYNAAFAEPYPSTVFLELLGLPVERTDEFLELKDGIIRPDAETAEERERMVQATGQQIYAVLEEVIDARIEEPRDDFISGFLTAEIEGEALTREDIVDIGYLFFLAGLDTVTASLDCMLAYLAQHPEQRQRLVDDPSVIPSAIEEMLRWETPVPGVVRKAVQDTELSGCPISAGSQVVALLASANTDEAEWDDPDTVDFDRSVNRHYTFGGGVHRCLGSHLARMELRVALEEWHARIPEYTLAEGTELIYDANLRQIEELPLVW